MAADADAATDTATNAMNTADITNTIQLPIPPLHTLQPPPQLRRLQLLLAHRPHTATTTIATIAANVARDNKKFDLYISNTGHAIDTHMQTHGQAHNHNNNHNNDHSHARIHAHNHTHIDTRGHAHIQNTSSNIMQ